jgi:uncharacterized phage protein (TIGR02220 family)
LPNRILREGILDSDRIESLYRAGRAAGAQAEVLFYRLLVASDDFGRFDGRVAVIRARCFPLKDQAQTGDLEAHLAALEAATLIRRYEVEGKPYLEIANARQRTRAERSRYPDPPALPAGSPTVDGQLTVTRPAGAHGDGDGDGDENTSGEPPDLLSGQGPGAPEREREVQARAERKGRGGKPKAGNGAQHAGETDDVLLYLNRVAGTRFQPTPKNRAFVRARLADGYTAYVLKLVAYDRARRWRHDPKMVEYLRPATLWNAEKCDQYAGQISPALLRACQCCGRELLPEEQRCPACPAPAREQQAPARPSPELMRREGEPVLAWVARVAASRKPGAPAPTH